MYTLLTGKHPFFRDNDNKKTYVNRISKQDLELDKLGMSEVAYSLFSKLCSRSISERYTSNLAIKHPWITRNFNDIVPMTQGQEVKMIEADTSFRKMQSLMFFMSVIKAQR